MAGVSFIHRAEVEHRHEIGVETMSFGRDYPHPESTWPHTREWMRDAFAGLPVDEVAAILGENVIRFLDLDHARLQVIADRVGPTVDEIVRSPAVPAELVEVFANRSGYLKPWEGDTKLDLVDNLLRDDLAPAGVQV
jgi:hypothetical protein